MANYALAGVHGLNKFVFSKLQSDLGWTLPSGLNPIMPAQTNPENVAFDEPFIIYSYNSVPSNTEWWIINETVTYTVYSQDESEVRAAIHYLSTLLARYDESAEEVNEWLNSSGSPDQKAFEYKYIRVTLTTSPGAAYSEGGRVDGSITFRTCYTVDLDSNGMRQ